MLRHTRASARVHHSATAAHIALVALIALLDLCCVHALLRRRGAALALLCSVAFGALAALSDARQAREVAVLLGANAAVALLHAAVPALDLGASVSVRF
jgi:hypothetical protein